MVNTSPNVLRHFAMVGALAATTWMGTALAQNTTPPEPSPTTTPEAAPTPTPNPEAPANGHETNTMENYLTNHPKAADELHNNPSLINDPSWLAKHPNVQNYMNNHPNLKADAASNPNQFVNHTEHETLNRDRASMNRTDDFLSKHPETAKELSKDPSLIDNPKYLAQPSGARQLFEKQSQGEERMAEPPRGI